MEKLRRTGALLIAAMMIISGLAIEPVNALTADDTFYGGNNINFYDPNFAYDTTGCSEDGEVTGNATTLNGLKKSDRLEKIFQALVNGGMNSVQASAVMGNMYVESGFEPGIEEKGNGIGYGLAQWSFGRRTNLENYAKAQGKPVSDLDLQLAFLLKEYNDSYKSQLEDSPFDEGTVVKAATREWMMTFEVPAMQPKDDPAGLNTRRIPAANTIYGYYKDLTPNASSAAVVPDCTSNEDNGVGGDAAVQGNIVQTALAYAWPYQVANGKVNKSNARPSYRTAKEKFNPGPAWSDCGGFIATVMRSSGVDPDYVSVSVAAQTKYVRANPSKYKIIDNPSAADLQPGDILLSAALGHTSMYVGPQKIGGKNYTTAQASLNQTVPNLRLYGSAEGYMLGTGNAIIARYIGKAGN